MSRRWGTQADEVRRALPGDELVTGPRWSLNHAITIDAPPSAVWPWLVQIGYQRGGLYSYDLLDRWVGILDAPSANVVLPAFQQLSVGDVIPLGAGPNWPVAAVEPVRALVLAPVAPGMEISWAFVLDPLPGGRTRLRTRVRANYSAGIGSALMMTLMDPAAFLMTRKMLLGIAARSERLANARQPFGVSNRSISPQPAHASPQPPTGGMTEAPAADLRHSA